MDKGFFGGLFDFSFSTLITPKIIRAIYIVITIVAGLVSFVFFINMATAEDGNALVGFVLAPLLFLLYMIFARIYLEVVIILFRIGEDVRRIADGQGGIGGGGGMRPPTII